LHIVKLQDLSVADDVLLAWEARRSAEPTLGGFLTYVMSQQWRR
jgi:hypothetical protein